MVKRLKLPLWWTKVGKAHLASPNGLAAGQLIMDQKAGISQEELCSDVLDEFRKYHKQQPNPSMILENIDCCLEVLSTHVLVVDGDSIGSESLHS
jgi:hypothetical protein